MKLFEMLEGIVDFAVITATGKDKLGLIAEITSAVSRGNRNIVDI